MTDGLWTDGRTDRPSYRDARTHLKIDKTSQSHIMKMCGWFTAYSTGSNVSLVVLDDSSEESDPWRRKDGETLKERSRNMDRKQTSLPRCVLGFSYY